MNPSGGNKFRVTLIEEGLGNLGDRFYYTRQALEDAANRKIFEGEKFFIDHPTKEEDVIRPERSTRDIAGYYENVHIEDGDAGQALLVADLNILPDPSYNWVRTMCRESINVSGRFQKDLIGISINANGDSSEVSLESFMADSKLPLSVKPKLQEAMDIGIETINVCSKLTEVFSADLVTKAGAKGRIQKMLEQERKSMSKKISDSEKKLLEQNKKLIEANKKLLAKIRESEGEAEGEAESEATHAEADDADGDHADEQQDIELIKSMLKKYVGDDESEDKDMHEKMHQAVKHAKAMGMKHDEAHEAAAKAFGIGKKAAEAEGEAKHEAEGEGEAKHAEGEGEGEGYQADDGDGDGDQDGDGAPAGDHKPPKGKKMETELRAKISVLEQKVRANELKEYREKLVRESKFVGAQAKAFRECLATDTNEKQMLKTLKTFKEASKTAKLRESDFGFYPEKTVDMGDVGPLSLSDCKK